MSQQFDEAPPLPREPTALNVPHAMGTAQTDDTVTELPVDAHALPPPPKFPSLTDVALPSATAAAASLDPYTSRPTSAQLSDNIASVLTRDAVAPGTGAKKVIEIGQRMWTLDDQRELDLLLSQGKDVYVPPDVTVDDISGRPSSYVLVPDEDDVKGQRSIGGRVVSWNHVLPAEGTDHVDPPIVVAPVPDTTTDDTQSRAIPDDANDKLDTTPTAEQADEKEGDTTTRSLDPAEGATAPPPVDVSKTIFGARFLLVPVTSRRNNTVPIREPETTEIAEPNSVELRTDSAAHINVTDDYGLKGGHETGTNDAAFLKDGSLITCGNDGRVCIWDMNERVVDSEFVPYNGEAVTMVYPLPDEEDITAKTIMTLSKSRIVRIWSVDEHQAVLLRSWQVKASEKALYMNIPHISKEVKARAAAAAAAAAVTTTDAPELPAQNESFNTAPAVPQSPTQETDAPTSAVPAETRTPVSMETPTQAKTQFMTDASHTITPDTPEAPTPTTTPATAETAEQTTAPTEAAPSTGATSNELPTTAPIEERPEEEKERKRFSFTKVLSFGRSSGDRKALAS